MSLNNLSVNLSEKGDVDAALDASQEAVQIRRRLSSSNPSRYEPDLARSLGSQGVVLRAQGELALAVASFREGCELVRPYAKKYPGSPFEELLKTLTRHLETTEQMIP